MCVRLLVLGIMSFERLCCFEPGERLHVHQIMEVSFKKAGPIISISRQIISVAQLAYVLKFKNPYSDRKNAQVLITVSVTAGVLSPMS